MKNVTCYKTVIETYQKTISTLKNYSMKDIFTLLICFTVLTACQETPKKRIKIVDYNSNKALDSIINNTPQSKDTVFLGFRMGMSQKEYKKHIEALKKEGKTITFSDSNRFSTASGNIFNIGPGYTFQTAIAIDKNKGFGKYVLQPVYENGRMIKINIFPFEEWENYGSGKPNWLKTNITKSLGKTINSDIKKLMAESGEIDVDTEAWIKKDVIVYKTIWAYTYIETKAIFEKVKAKRVELQKTKESNKKIKF